MRLLGSVILGRTHPDSLGAKPQAVINRLDDPVEVPSSSGMTRPLAFLAHESAVANREPLACVPVESKRYTHLRAPAPQQTSALATDSS